MVNIAFLEKALTRAKQGDHNQGLWIGIETDNPTKESWADDSWCGTQACLAGHACLLAGDLPAVDGEPVHNTAEFAAMLGSTSDNVSEVFVADSTCVGDGYVTDVMVRAGELLEFDGPERSWWFGGSRTILEFEFALRLLKAGSVPEYRRYMSGF